MKKMLVIGAGAGESSISAALVKSGNRVALIDPWAIETNAHLDVEAQFPAVLGNRAELFAAVEKSIAALDGLDAVVITVANDAACTVDKLECDGALSQDAWDNAISKILYGSFHATQAALRYMVPRKSGTILYLCADNAVDGQVLDPGIAAATCGLLALSSSLAASAFRQGLTMNAVIVGDPFAPIEIAPEMPPKSEFEGLAYIPNSAFSALRDQALYKIAQQAGFGWHESVVAMVEYLCNQPGSMLTGASLRLTNVSRRAPWIRWTY